MNTMKLLGWSLLLVAPLAHAGGQGLYLRVDVYAPDPSMHVDGSHCMGVAPTALLGQRQYVEASRGLGCLGSPSWFDFSIWSRSTRIAAYRVTVSAWKSSIDESFHDLHYLAIDTLYPHEGLFGSQDYLTLSATDEDTRAWMGALNPRLRLDQLSLPGTHDSGTATISAHSPLAVDASPAIAAFAHVAPGVIAGWSRTQSDDIALQLLLGIRYLDLRLCGDPELDSIHACHALQGQKFTTIVEQIRQFVQAHPREIVIMDLNHWYCANGEVQRMRDNVFAYLRRQLGSTIAGRDRFDPASTLGSLWAARKSVIVASDDTQGRDYVWHSVNTSDPARCAGDTDICSYWPAAADIRSATQRLAQALRQLQGRPHRYLFVLQTQLTPELQTILTRNSGNLFSFTGSYAYDMSQFLDTPGRFDGLSGIIFLQDFSNGIDLLQRARSLIPR